MGIFHPGLQALSLGYSCQVNFSSPTDDHSHFMKINKKNKLFNVILRHQTDDVPSEHIHVLAGSEFWMCLLSL